MVHGAHGAHAWYMEDNKNMVSPWRIIKMKRKKMLAIQGTFQRTERYTILTLKNSDFGVARSMRQSLFHGGVKTRDAAALPTLYIHCTWSPVISLLEKERGFG